MISGHHENPVYLYILEVLSACLICYFLYLSFPEYKLIWAMIYIPVVISPIREKSRLLAFSRIKANFLGAFFGFLVLLFFDQTFLSFSLAAIATIIFCNALKIIETARSALLTLVTVVIPHYSEPQYVVALERTICVTCGCFIALVVIIVSDHLCLRFAQSKRQAGINGN